MTDSVSTTGELTGVAGTEYVSLDTPSAIRRFRRDPEGFFAKLNNATVAQYHAWLETQGRPRCAGFTKKGKRCRALISGGSQRPFTEWLRLDRVEYCVVHGGPSRDELA